MSSSSSSSSGYCSDTIYAEGFAIKLFDGIYIRNGEHSGKPYWKHQTNLIYMYWSSDNNYWALGYPFGFIGFHSIVGITCPYDTDCTQWIGVTVAAGIVCKEPLSSSSSDG